MVFRNLAAGTGTIAGACVRRGVVEKDSSNKATIRWLEDARNVDGLGDSGFAVFPYTLGVWISAGDGVLTVMYAATTSKLPIHNDKNPGENPCPDDCPLENGMAWATVDSFDNGHTWVDNSKIFHTEHSKWCVIGEVATPNQGCTFNTVATVGQVLIDIRPFALARAPGGMLYALVQDTRHTMRLFMSPAAGTKGWRAYNSTIRTWYEWCPGTPTSDVPGGPTSNWKSTGVDNPDQLPCATPAIDSDKTCTADTDPNSTCFGLVFPAIAVDGRGNVAISDVEEVKRDLADPTAHVQYMMRGIVNPQMAGAVLQGPTAISATSFTLPTQGFLRPLGDYTWIAVRPQGSHFRAPGCTTTNDFFPLWTANLDTSGDPGIITRGFSLTPP